MIIVKNRNTAFNLLIIVFAFAFVFTSSDANLHYQTDLTIAFRKIFYSGIRHIRLFKLMDYLLIAISFFLIRFYGLNFKSSKSVLKFIWIITLINTFFIFINPNHNAKYMFLGLPILSDVSIYTFLLFMYTLFFIKESGIIYFVKVFVKYLVIFAIVKAIFLFLMWSMGKGFNFWGFYSILMEEDNLLLYAFLQLIAFYLFISTKEKKYLMIWALFVLIEILSFRRSGLFITFLSLGGFLTYLYLNKSNIVKKISFAFAVLLLFVLIINTVQFLPTTPKIYLARYLGEFIQIPGIPSHLDLVTNKHLEQAEYGLDAAIDLLPFWGYGFGHDIEKASLFYGSNTAIHNSFVATWMYHSPIYTIYILLLGLIALYGFYMAINSSRYTNFNILVSIFLTVFFINHWVLPLANVVELKMMIFRTFLFALLFRITSSNLSFILPKK